MLQLALDFLGQQVTRIHAPRPPRLKGDAPWPWKHGITVQFVFRPRARRYTLRLQPDGAARLVIPRRGTQAEAVRFLERSEAWLLKRKALWQSQTREQVNWSEGTKFLFRGEEVILRVENGVKGVVLRFSDQAIHVPEEKPCFREAVLEHLRALAAVELPARTLELARLHKITVARISIRAQKTRWGSCSAHGTISLNWRLIHAPLQVVDYLIIHELMHRREMNHSARYWKLVASAFPAYREAEKWLKRSRIESMA